VKEVVGVVVLSAKKWIVEEGQQLIHTWINIDMDAIARVYQKKLSF